MKIDPAGHKKPAPSCCFKKKKQNKTKQKQKQGPGVVPPQYMAPGSFWRKASSWQYVYIWSCVVWWDTKIVGDVTLCSHLSNITYCHRTILSPIELSLGLFYSLIILLSKYVLQIKIRICLISLNH